MAERAKTIRWSEEEWDIVVARGAYLFITNAAESQTEAFRMANEEMPIERRRIRSENSKLDPYMFSNWKSRWDTAIENATQQLRAEKQAKVLQADSAPEVAPESAHPTAQVPNQPAPAITDLLTQAFVDAFLLALESPRGQDAIRNALKVPGGVAVESVLPKVSATAINVKPPAVMRKRSVLIVGLLGQQQQEIRKSHGEVFDLRFLGTGDSAARIKQNAESVDTVFGMVGFINHSIYTHLRKKSKDFHHVNGTVSDVKRLLTGMQNA